MPWATSMGSPGPTRRNCPFATTTHRCPFYTGVGVEHTGSMTRHRIDIDEEALREARTALGTDTIGDTVNEALRRVTASRDRVVSHGIDTMAKAKLTDRADAWR